MRANAREQGYTTEWSNFARTFLKSRPVCEVCRVNPSYVCGHWVMSGREMMEKNGKFILNPTLYKALCRSCNALSKHRRGI